MRLMTLTLFSLLWLALARASADSVSPPAPYGPAPSAAQLAWNRRELSVFVNFNMNIFTGSEWESGQEARRRFNPPPIAARSVRLHILDAACTPTK